MCRKCGAPDRRPSSKRRKVINRRLLEMHGNGIVAPCFWCGILVAVPRNVGYLAVGGKRLKIVPMERDRLEPGGPYSLWNLVPSCHPCNIARAYVEVEVPEGCLFGSGIRRLGGDGMPIQWRGPEPTRSDVA